MGGILPVRKNHRVTFFNLPFPERNTHVVSSATRRSLGDCAFPVSQGLDQDKSVGPGTERDQSPFLLLLINSISERQIAMISPTPSPESFDDSSREACRTFRFTKSRTDTGSSSESALAESSVNTSAATVPSATPAITRPRGRFLIAAVMLAACASGLFTVGDNLLRYKAYGVVTGKIVNVSAPIDGVPQFVHVRQGDHVRQDSRLATVFDLTYEQKMSRIEDEINVAKTDLHAQLAKVRWESHVQETEITRSLADFFEGAGAVHEQEGTLAVIRKELKRTQQLIAGNDARESDLVNQSIQESANEDILLAVERAWEVLKERAEKAADALRLGAEQIKPLVAKVDLLLNETKRIRERMAQGDLRAPVNGIILSRHQPAGECIRSHETLFSMMEESSLEIELFLPQEMTASYDFGDTIELRQVPCEVVSCWQRTPPAASEY